MLVRLYPPPGGGWIFRADEGGSKKTGEERRDVGRGMKPGTVCFLLGFRPHSSSVTAGAVPPSPPGEGMRCAALVGAVIDRPPCLPRFEGGGFAARRRRRELTPQSLPYGGDSPLVRGGPFAAGPRPRPTVFHRCAAIVGASIARPHTKANYRSCSRILAVSNSTSRSSTTGAACSACS